MLVLTRKIGESIIIDNDIKVQILDVRKKQIRIGIEAPESILIFREEIYKKILASQQNRTAMDPGSTCAGTARRAPTGVRDNAAEVKSA